MVQYAHPDILVSTQWLADHLNDPKLRIVEVNMSPEPYQGAHIPGAVFWNVFTDLLKRDLSMNLEPAAIAHLLSRSGITQDTAVVAYGSYPGTGGWIAWLLRMFGHQPVYVLNGGYQKWRAEGRPLAASLSSYAATSYPTPAPNEGWRASATEVQAALAQPDAVVVDVRTPEEYRGEIFMLEPPKDAERGGHIPGAVHLEHTLTLNEDGTFKSPEELRALYDESGVTPDKTVLPYCAIGARSAYTCFLLIHLLGYPKVRNYDGSWNEWSRLPHTLVEPSS